jgi:membrane-associated phospholipid phosphatase
MDMGLDQNIVKTAPGRRTVLARWISRIIHPITFPLLTLGIVTYYADPSQGVIAAARWVLIALLLTSVPITLLVMFQVLRGKWTDLDVSVRRQRYTLYPFGLACMVALAIVFRVLQAPAIAVSATAAIVVANLVNALINLRYKVSAHATSAALCTAILSVGAPIWAIPAGIATLLVGWSRVVLGRHTTGQVILGWLVGAASVSAVLLLPARFGI